ncbi:MAG: hypothetical protein HY561_00165 [Gemmatimonadetes bacterium]|nr:hypothetical protein [Gemmatimonadota bacterium]
MRKRMIHAIVLVLLTPLALSAQGGARGEGRGEAEAEARIEAALEQALEAGVPVSLLESKIEEGKAKGVSMTRIASTIEHRLEVLLEAKQAMEERGREARPGELAAAAFALESGAEANAVAEVGRSAPPEQREEALIELGELVAHGESSARAAALVQADLLREARGAAELAHEGVLGLRIGQEREAGDAAETQPEDGRARRPGERSGAGASVEARGAGSVSVGAPSISGQAQGRSRAAVRIGSRP